MRYALISLIVLSLIGGNLVLGAWQARPTYLKYCDPSDSASLVQIMNAVDLRLNILTDLLSRLDRQNLQPEEGIILAEDFLDQWATNPDNLQDCQIALRAEVQTVTYEILLALLYETTSDQINTNRHILRAKESLVAIRSQIKNATTYLNSGSFLTAEPPVAESSIRTNTELAQITYQYLTDSGLAVLRSVTVSGRPGTVSLMVEINDVPDVDDYTNVLYVLDRLSTFMADWNELNQVSIIIVEVYDQNGARTLFVATSGADFVAYYYEATITLEEFEARLTHVD